MLKQNIKCDVIATENYTVKVYIPIWIFMDKLQYRLRLLTYNHPGPVYILFRQTCSLKKQKLTVEQSLETSLTTAISKASVFRFVRNSEYPSFSSVVSMCRQHPSVISCFGSCFNSWIIRYLSPTVPNLGRFLSSN